MEFLIPEVYTGAFGVLCKALAQAGQRQIAEKKDTFWVDFDVLVNLPKPNEIITRCFVSVLRLSLIAIHTYVLLLGSVGRTSGRGNTRHIDSEFPAHCCDRT